MAPAPFDLSPRPSFLLMKVALSLGPSPPRQQPLLLFLVLLFAHRLGSDISSPSRRISAQVRSSVWRSTQAHSCRDHITYPCHPPPARCCVSSSATVSCLSGSARPTCTSYNESDRVWLRNLTKLAGSPRLEQNKRHTGQSVPDARNDRRLASADEGRPRGKSEKP